MNKGIIKKVSCMALAGFILLSGQALAAENRATLQNKLQESDINSIIANKTLGYSANYDLRKYKYITIESIGNTNANWAIVASKLLEYSNKGSMEMSAKHIDYATAYNSTTEGNTNAHNRNLGQPANMKVALGYITSGRGPVSKSDFDWDGNLNKVSNSTLNSKKVANTIESYKIFPSMYKMTFDAGNGTKFTYAYNDPIIYTSTESNVGNKFSATKNINSYTGGEIEQVREDIKTHIIKYGAVSASLYRNGLNYYVYRTGGNLEQVTYSGIDDGSEYHWKEWERHYKPEASLSYYCSEKKLTPNHDVVIIGWDDTYQVPGAPGVGAYLVMDPTVIYTQYYSDWYEGWRWRDGAVYESSVGEWLVPRNLQTVNTNYYYVSYYDYYIESNVYGIKDTSYASYSKTYQHDVLGMSTSIDAINASTIAYGANVFNRNTTTPETLNAVSIASESNMKYEIYVNPKSGELTEDKLIKVATTDVLEAGYNTIHLDNTVVLTGDKFAVAVKYIPESNSGTVSVARIGVEAPRQKMYYMVSANQTETRYDNIDFWYGRATSSQGQSYIGSNLSTWTDLYSQSETKDTNICIKAFVTTNPNYEIPAEQIEIKQQVKDTFGDIIEEDITEDLKILKGDSITLGATVSPSDAAKKSVSWTSSNKSVATVDKDGVVVTHAAGVAKITARLTNAPTIYAECTIDVRVPVESFTLNKNNVTILAGETNVLAAIIGPDDATTTKVEWSSNNREVVRVTEEGLLIGMKQGSAIVTAVLRDENGTHTATCKVTVPVSLVVDVTGISLNKTSLQLIAGTRETLTATILPADATNTAVVWTSSNKSVAIVNSNGRITALSPGTATITATTVSGGETASCTVTVVEEETVKVTGVSLNANSVALEKDQTTQLVANVKPGNSANQNVNWSSNNLDVAEVNSNGRVTAIAPGTATITVKTEDGGYTATCEVTVIKPKVRVTGITLDKTLVTVEKDSSVQLIAGVQPANADNAKINWTTSNESIATVDDTGLVKAVGYGDAIITATTEDGGYYKKCIISVPEIVAVTGIQLSATELTIEKGITAELKVNVLPENATNTGITYEVENEKIASFAGDGIKAIDVGQTTITFKTEDGGYTATCKVNVVQPTEELIVTSNNYQISKENKIYEVPKNTTVQDFKNNITTNGTITKIVNKKDEILSDDSKVGTGTKMTITKEITTTSTGGTPTTTTITKTYVIRVDGDLNGDGNVSITDYSILKQYIIQQMTLEGIEYEAGDLNKDGKITLTDLSMIKQQLLGEEEV